VSLNYKHVSLNYKHVSLNYKHNAEFHDFYAPLTIVQVIKSRIVRRIEDLVMTTEGRRPRG
jgi:hypothetical protein